MRRISTGIVGREILGRFTALDNSLRSIENNQDIVLNPNGSGIIQSDAHIQVNDENSVRFADSGSSNYVEIKAPASLGSNITLTLPNGTGSSGDVLTIDGSGNLSFSGINVNVNNQSADTLTYYPLMSTNTSGEIGDLSVSSSKLSFVPNTGTLTVTKLSSDDVDIGGGSIDGTTIGGSSSAAGTFTSVSTGTINITGNTTIGNGTSDRLDINALVESDIIPTGTRNLGSASNRWNNVFVNDLNLSNGIGDYTIVEGKEDLFLYNNKTNKVYKFDITEVDPAAAPEKKE